MATVAITAVEVTGWAARLVVTVSGATVGATLTVTRDGSPVLGGVGLPAASTVLHDAAPPLNRRLSWTAALSTGESATAVLPGIKSRRTIVSSPHRGLIAECTAAEQGQTQHEARVAVIPIENSPQPVIIEDRQLPPAYDREFDTDPDAETDAFHAVASLAGTLLVRHTCPTVRDAWVRQTGTRRSETHHPDDWVTHTLSLMEVGIPDVSMPASGDTLGDLAAAIPTSLGDIAAEWSTLGDIAAADLKAMR